MADDKPIFSKVAQGLPTGLVGTKLVAAKEWFKQQVSSIRDVDISKMFTEASKQLMQDINITSIGSMYHFTYDPKGKDKLPYYDTVPLVFVVEVYKDGFLGINLHYLDPYYRAKLMDALYTITLKKGDIMKVQLSYNVLKSASKFRLFRPCLKRYLTNHVQSQYLFIKPDNWDMVLLLPSQRFVQSTKEKVWKDSMSKVNAI